MLTATQRTERSARILELRNQGLTLQAIGDEVGLTRERVRQLLVEQGVRILTREQRIDIAIADWKQTGRVRRVEDVARAYDIACTPRNLAYLRDAVPLLALPNEQVNTTRWTEEEIVFAVRDVATANGIDPKTGWMTSDEYDALRQPGDPSPSTITSSFLWSHILYGAGFSKENRPAMRGRHPGYRPQRFTEDDLDAAVMDYLNSTTERLSAQGFDRFLRNHEYHPCMATVRNRFRAKGILSISGIFVDVQARCQS